jgi:hypothetical protein
MPSAQVLRRSLVLASLAIALAIGACGDETSETEEPEIASMIVTLGASSYTATSGGFSSPTVTLATATTTVSVSFLRADASFDPVVGAPDFQVSVAGDADGGPLPARVTFERTSSFAGNLVVSGATPLAATPIYFSLRHVAEGHDDFGPFALTVQRF